jgi:hypothetical protein
MRRLILFLQSAAALTRHEATVLLWLTGLVLLGTIGGNARDIITFPYATATALGIAGFG